MAERTLILMRHGKSDWSGDEDDAARPLAPRGLRQAPEAGRWLNANVPGIDLAIVSPAVRAVSTWKLAAAELDAPPTVTIDHRVYDASTDDLQQVVRGVPDEVRTLMMVGHNPTFEDLALELTGEWTEMPTSAIAILDVPGAWADVTSGSATLKAAGRPPSPVGREA